MLYMAAVFEIAAYIAEGKNEEAGYLAAAGFFA